jgi:DNA polymerase III subunit delta
VILKSYIVEQKIIILNDYNTIVFYGENDGLKNDFKIKIKNIYQEAEIVNLFQEELLKNTNLLTNEISNLSLFSSQKVIFLNEISDKIFNQIEECTVHKNSKTKVIIFSNNLDKKSKLRNYFEKEKNLAIVACYADNERSLHTYILSKLKDFKGLNGEIVNLIMKNSDYDRKTVSGEIEKIKTLFLDKKIIKENLKELLNIKSSNKFENIRDASLLGKKEEVNMLIGELQFLREDNFFYLNQINRRLTKLIEIKIINEQTNNLETSIERLKPKLFWKDKPIVLEQTKRWSLKKLQTAVNMTFETELSMKKKSYLRDDLLIKNLIIKLCQFASSAS